MNTVFLVTYFWDNLQDHDLNMCGNDTLGIFDSYDKAYEAVQKIKAQHEEFCKETTEESYGSYSYLLGAYDTKDKTIPVEVRDGGAWRVAIQEIEVNKTYKIKKDDWGYYETEFPTGVYAE